MSEYKYNSFIKPVGRSFDVGSGSNEAMRATVKAAYNIGSVCEGKLKANSWEARISERIAEQQQVELRPMETHVPLAALAPKRALSVSNASVTVENEVADYVIPAVRANIALPGATIIPQAGGQNLFIPRFATPGAAGSGETVTVSAGTVTFEQVQLTPIHYSSQIVLSNQLIQQAKTTPSIEDVIKGYLTETVSRLIDNLCINGTGKSNGQSLGILNYPVQGAGSYDPLNLAGSITFGGVPTLTKVVNAHAALDSANYPESDRVWLLSPAARGVWEGTPMITGYPRFLYDGGRVLNYPAIVTNQLSATNQAVFVRQSEAVIALFGGFVSVLSNPYTLAYNNQTLLTVGILADFALVRGGAVISTDSAAV